MQTGIAEIASELVRQIRSEVENERRHPPTAEGALYPRLLTAKQAAGYIGRSEQAVRHMIFQRAIPVVRYGRCVRVDRNDLDRWIESNKA